MKCVCALITVTVLLMAADFHGVESKRMESMDDIKKAVKALRKTCQQKTGASKEILDGAVNGQFPPDKQLQCYLRCLMTMTKAMKNDKVQVEFLRKQADLMLPTAYIERFHKLIDVCSEKVDASEPDGCVLAWNVAKCLYETDSELYFLP